MNIFDTVLLSIDGEPVEYKYLGTSGGNIASFTNVATGAALSLLATELDQYLYKEPVTSAKTTRKATPKNDLE